MLQFKKKNRHKANNTIFPSGATGTTQETIRSIQHRANAPLSSTQVLVIMTNLGNSSQGSSFLRKPAWQGILCCQLTGFKNQPGDMPREVSRVSPRQDRYHHAMDWGPELNKLGKRRRQLSVTHSSCPVRTPRDQLPPPVFPPHPHLPHDRLYP